MNELHMPSVIVATLRTWPRFMKAGDDTAKARGFAELVIAYRKNLSDRGLNNNLSQAALSELTKVADAIEGESDHQWAEKGFSVLRDAGVIND